jgi:hypothetical protein
MDWSPPSFCETGNEPSRSLKARNVLTELTILNDSRKKWRAPLNNGKWLWYLNMTWTLQWFWHVNKLALNSHPSGTILTLLQSVQKLFNEFWSTEYSGVKPKTVKVRFEDIVGCSSMKIVSYTERENASYVWKPSESNSGILHLQCSYNLDYLVFSNYVKIRLVICRHLLPYKHTVIQTVTFYITKFFSVNYLIWKKKWPYITSDKGACSKDQ